MNKKNAKNKTAKTHFIKMCSKNKQSKAQNDNHQVEKLYIKQNKFSNQKTN